MYTLACLVWGTETDNISSDLLTSSLALEEAAMGISTFAHLLTDLELEAMQAPLSDADINAVIQALCARPHAGSDDKSEVDVLQVILSLLRGEDAGNGATKNHIYLEQKQKFWEATLSGAQVNVRYGKKGSSGQTSQHIGADARAFFDKKVKEKLKGGYKEVDPLAAKKKKAIEDITSKQGVEGAKKRAKTPVKHRFDFDKCAELVSFATARALKLDSAKSAPEMFECVFGKSQSIGSDVCYGPAYILSSNQISSISEQIATLSADDFGTAFDQGDFPSCLGALCDVSKERDFEYALVHFQNLKDCVAEAVLHDCGLLLHFW